ncbi:uncharacterized protein Dvar_25810 [Desulfosarcina variabilis str. Montpellier]
MSQIERHRRMDLSRFVPIVATSPITFAIYPIISIRKIKVGHPLFSTSHHVKKRILAMELLIERQKTIVDGKSVRKNAYQLFSNHTNKAE